LTLELPLTGDDATVPPLRGPIPLFRRRLRRFLGHGLAAVCNAFFPTPIGRRLHARLLGALEVVVLDVELPGAAADTSWPSIAFLSDLHAGHYMTGADLGRLAHLIDALRPDVLCLGGDLINHHAEELAHLEPLLAGLRPPLGVFAVPGNHDYVRPGELDAWLRFLEHAGVHVLRNRGQRLERAGGSLWLCGVDDLTEGEPRLADALAGRRAGEPTLLLSHHPDLFREASARGVDLQLSGHTHGGQVRLGPWIPMHHSRFDWVNGLYARGDARLFVGRGAGVTALPVRVGTRSEITLIRPRGTRNG